MAGEKLLSDATCKRAKPKENVYYLNDGGGLRLRVRNDGSKNWIQRFRLGKSEKSLGLGVYPKVSLADARDKLLANRELIRRGEDPISVKRDNTQRREIDAVNTFKVIASEFLAHNKSAWSDSHYIRNEGIIRRFLLPKLGSFPIRAVSEKILFQVIKFGYDGGAKDSARRARAIAAQIFRHAKDTQRCSSNVALELARNSYFKKPSVEHFTAIKPELVPELIRLLRLEGEEQILEPNTVAGLLLTIHTGLRERSLLGAKWKEISYKNALWTIPPERMKSGREHVVPLPDQALKVLRNLELITKSGDDSFLFVAKTKSGHMSGNTMRLALHRLGFKVTVHGFRSLITDVLNEKGFNSDAVERQLDHIEGSQVRRAYLRTKFLDERVKMMQWFADWCEGKDDGKDLISGA
jgi:integrase